MTVSIEVSVHTGYQKLSRGLNSGPVYDHQGFTDQDALSLRIGSRRLALGASETKTTAQCSEPHLFHCVTTIKPCSCFHFQLPYNSLIAESVVVATDRHSHSQAIEIPINKSLKRNQVTWL